MMTICVAGPAEIVKLPLSAVVSPLPEAANVLDPARLILRFANVATPDAFVGCEVVPESAPLPVAIAALMTMPEV